MPRAETASTIVPLEQKLQILGLSSGGAPSSIDVIAHFAGGGTASTTANTCPPGKYIPVIRNAGGFDVPSANSLNVG